jgi:hypothetical protein
MLASLAACGSKGFEMNGIDASQTAVTHGYGMRVLHYLLTPPYILSTFGFV